MITKIIYIVVQQGTKSVLYKRKIDNIHLHVQSAYYIYNTPIGAMEVKPLEYDSQIAALYSNDAFWKITNNIPVTLYEFNLVTNLLVATGIPYDVSHVPGTRKYAGSFQLTIHINPGRTGVYVIALENGSSVFSPSP